jgi:hypothetical protein
MLVPDLTIRHGEHLFVSGDTNHVNQQHLGTVLIPPEVKEEWLTIIRSRQQHFLTRGSEFFFLIAPDKQTVYRHILPRDYQFRQSEFLSGLSCLVDVAPQLSTLSTILDVYPRTDSHWNQLGAYIAAQMLHGRRGLNMPSIPITWLENERIGDLGNKLDPMEPSARRYAHIRSQSHLMYDNLVPNNGRIRIWSKTRQVVPETKTKLVFFGDSFSYDVVHFLKEIYDLVVHVHAFAVDYRITDAVAPDLVVAEITERFLLRAPNPSDGEPLDALWAEKVGEGATLESPHGLVPADPDRFPAAALAMADLSEALFAPFRAGLNTRDP